MDILFHAAKLINIFHSAKYFCFFLRFFAFFCFVCGPAGQRTALLRAAGSGSVLLFVRPAAGRGRGLGRFGRVLATLRNAPAPLGPPPYHGLQRGSAQNMQKKEKKFTQGTHARTRF